jgi:MFS family permease
MAGPESASRPVAASSPVPPPPDKSRPWLARTFDSLGNRHFRFLWAGTLLAMGGFQMQSVARAILAYALTGDAFITGLVGVGWSPTLTIVSLFAGVIGDRVDRRVLIQLSQSGNAVCAGGAAILTGTGLVTWWHLLAISVVQGAMFVLQMPARQAIVPALVGRERSSNAIALNAMAMSLTTLVAPGIAGVLYDAFDAFDAFGVYLVLTLMMVLAVGATSLVPRMRPDTDVPKRSTAAQISEGLRYVAGNRLVLALIVQSVVVAILAFPVRMLINIPATEIYAVSAGGVGALLSAAGLGGVVGATFIAGLRRGQQRGKIVLLAGVLSGVAVLGLAAIPYFAVGMVAMVAMGLGESGRWALGQALIVEETPDHLRARVMSVIMMAFGLMAVGQLLLGALMREVGTIEALWIFGVLLTVAAGGFWTFSRRIRQLG